MKLKIIKPKTFGRMDMVEKTPEPYYPSFSIDLKDLPIAKDWKVGETYSIEMEVRQCEMQQSKGGKGSVRFEIMKINGESMEEEASENEAENYSRIKK